MHGFQGISLPLADPEACCIALESLQACLCKQLPVPAVRCTASLPKRKEKEKLRLLGVSSMRNQVLYRAAQELAEDSDHRNKLLFLHQSILQAMQTLSRTSKVCLVNKLKHWKGLDSAATKMFDTRENRRHSASDFRLHMLSKLKVHMHM